MNSLKKTLLPLIILFSVSSTLAETSLNCISHEDLSEIAESFEQLERFIGDKKEYCEKDLSSDWLKITQALVVLKNITPNEPATDLEDALTHKAITENNWWTYFTHRAQVFSIEKNCEANVVAYVMPFFRNGRIHLCQPFFEQTVSDQASTMMHEVRHFDGHRHVTCNRGNEVGSQGACDNQIGHKGSYAISVQTLVGLARSKQTSETERYSLEAEALYMAYNKFNTVPKIKIQHALYLSNEDSHVYKWDLKKNSIETVGTLKEPSMIYNSYNNITVYPLNVQSDAYRLDRTLNQKISNPGFFAVNYNKESIEERELYRSVSYFGTGILKENSLLSFCNGSEPYSQNLDNLGKFNQIISVSMNEMDSERVPLLLSDKGKLFSYECKSKHTKQVIIEYTGVSLNSPELGITQSFGLDGKQYALFENGSIATLSLSNNRFYVDRLKKTPFENHGWVSITPLSTPEVF